MSRVDRDDSVVSGSAEVRVWLTESAAPAAYDLAYTNAELAAQILDFYARKVYNQARIADDLPPTQY